MTDLSVPCRLQSVVKLLLLFVFLYPATGFSETLRLDYEGFTVWLDCELQGAVRFEYTVVKDEGNLPRLSSFKRDSDVSEECQQRSSGTYKHSVFSFDRGHLVPANHLDHLPQGIRQSNFMTNILPQARVMNRGAWKLTEEIIECHRDRETLRVIGGVVWGYNPDDDFFLESHNVATPDYFWKVIVGAQRAIAWLVPNSHGAKRSRLDLYLVSIDQLETIIGRTLDVPTQFKELRPETSWTLPAGCDRS